MLPSGCKFIKIHFSKQINKLLLTMQEQDKGRITELSFELIVIIQQFQMLNRSNRISKSTQKLNKSNDSNRNINVFERLSNHRSQTKQIKVIDSSTRTCPFHFTNSVPLSNYITKKYKVVHNHNNKPIQHKNQFSTFNIHNSKSSEGLMKFVKKANLQSFYEQSQKKGIKKIKGTPVQYQKFLNDRNELEKGQTRNGRIERKGLANIVNIKQSKNCKNTQTSIIENNSWTNNIAGNHCYEIGNKQKMDLPPTQLSIQIFSPAKENEKLHAHKLDVQNVLSVKIEKSEVLQNNRAQIQNSQLKIELQKYKGQCAILEQQLRQTLETVKSMTGQLQAANIKKVGQVIGSSIQSPITNPQPKVQQPAQYPYKVISFVKNEHNRLAETVPTGSQPGTQGDKEALIIKSNQVSKAEANMVESGRIVQTITPTVISSNSPRIIRLGRDRSYCKKGCTTFCNCLCQSHLVPKLDVYSETIVNNKIV